MPRDSKLLNERVNELQSSVGNRVKLTKSEMTALKSIFDDILNEQKVQKKKAPKQFAFPIRAVKDSLDEDTRLKFMKNNADLGLKRITLKKEHGAYVIVCPYVNFTDIPDDKKQLIERLITDEAKKKLSTSREINEQIIFSPPVLLTRFYLNSDHSIDAEASRQSNSEVVSIMVVEEDGTPKIQIKGCSFSGGNLEDRKKILRTLAEKAITLWKESNNERVSSFSDPITLDDIRFIPRESYPVPGYIMTHVVNSTKNIGGIPVQIIQQGEKTLVKVGPCDLSGVGGHTKREEILRKLVEQALLDHGVDKSYEEVNISACVGVRGRMQKAFSWFMKNNEGSHMNGYIKTAGESFLTHWEPRKGPQSFFNDTICSMVISTATSLFEHNVMKQQDGTYSSEQATVEILKVKKMKSLFDRFLASVGKKINDLVNEFKEFKNDDCGPPKPGI